MGFFSSTTLLLCASSLALLLPVPASAINQMLSGDTLKSGEFLSVVADDTYSFIMQRDCNLVLYRLGKALWASHTDRSSILCYVTLQRDGNLVIFNFEREPIWKSDTDGEDGEYILILQKNGNVALYKQPVWEIGTGGVMVTAGNSTAAAGVMVGGRKAKMVRIVAVTGDE